MIMLSMVASSTIGMVFAMVYGIFSSLALPLETIILPIYAGDLFGEKSYGKVLGIIVSVNVAGYAFGAPVINFCFDVMGSYNFAFYIGAIIMAMVLVGLQIVIGQAHKERKNIELSANESEN
jgi:MFS family permease